VAHVGRSVKRREDERLLQGRGAYVADVRRPFALHLALVRSPHAHARIRGIDVRAARARPGVVDVVTFADITALADNLHIARENVGLERARPGGLRDKWGSVQVSYFKVDIRVGGKYIAYPSATA